MEYARHMKEQLRANTPVSTVDDYRVDSTILPGGVDPISPLRLTR
jgi:hypothetical protein